MIQEEVVGKQRDLVCAWLDYKKAFDTVPHDWLIESLRLAKVHPQLIRAIEALTKNWATKLSIVGSDSTIESDIIKYSTGVFQGDSLSVLLFILALNPLSHLLQQRKGYCVGPTKERNFKITHLFFVDDLKLFAANLDEMNQLLDLVTTFSKDIGMEFGESKCSYMEIRRGRAVTSAAALEMNGVKISPVRDGDTYRYLGVDESVTYSGPLNKERATSEYYKRIRKIWASELSAQNKCTAHNSFAVPVLTPTFDILQWSIEELEAIDIKTRKILTSTGNFHRNGDVDRLYLPRSEGGRGVKSLYTAYKSRVVSIHQHLLGRASANPFLQKVVQHEQEGICRIAKQLIQSLGVQCEPVSSPSIVGKMIVSAVNRGKKEAFQDKVMHGYTFREMQKKPDVDLPVSLSWYKNKRMTSEFEAYATAVQEQEVACKYLLKNRQISTGNEVITSNKCRLCRNAVEDTCHIVAGCDRMAARYYIPLRHDPVARYIWNAIRRKDYSERSFDKDSNLDLQEGYIDAHECHEYWWNLPVKTCTKLKHNRPDIIAWDHAEKHCTIIEVSCPLDTNIISKEKEKEIIYGPLIRNLQLMHRGYTFTFVPIVIGATGYVSKALHGHLERIGFSERQIPFITRKLQVLSVSGTVKITKTFLKFKM